MAVDTTTSSATVTFTAQATDDLSGVGGVSTGVNSPLGDQGTSCGMSLISGTNLNGTWQCTITIQAYSDAGTWVVPYVSANDVVGNVKTYYTNDLIALGFPTSLNVESCPDKHLPSFMSLTFFQ